MTRLKLDYVYSMYRLFEALNECFFLRTFFADYGRFLIFTAGSELERGVFPFLDLAELNASYMLRSMKLIVFRADMTDPGFGLSSFTSDLVTS